ncbi:MAG: hypothetical protein U5O39_03665 [Gammaproteobacteria bacterium]|nr:hypothetical protein [Gammaproteobacteria bacterium]
MRLLAPALVVLMTACSGGGDPGAIIEREEETVGAPGRDGGCSDACALSAGDVERVIAQAVAEADARDAPATIAVVDRVGNVLGV